MNSARVDNAVMINIVFRSWDRSCHFKMKRTATLQRAIELYANTVGLPVQLFRMSRDGQTVHGSDTPESVNTPKRIS